MFFSIGSVLSVIVAPYIILFIVDKMTKWTREVILTGSICLSSIALIIWTIMGPKIWQWLTIREWLTVGFLHLGFFIPILILLLGVMAVNRNTERNERIESREEKI